MAHVSGTLLNFADFLDKFKDFTCGKVTQSYAGTGNGPMTLLDPRPLIVTETWTITCITEAANGGTFSVVGSVTGATANATVGTEYDNGYIRFKINDGSTDFQDATPGPAAVFTVNATASPLGAQTWECLKDSNVRTDFQDVTNGYITGANITNATTGPFDRRMYLKSTGLGGTDEIYHCLTSFHSSTSYFNVELRNMTSYNSSLPLQSQSGVSPVTYMCLNNNVSANLYRFVANGRRAILLARIGSVYESGYIGWGYPNGSPTDFPMPYMCGGSQHTYSGLSSDVGDSHRAFFAPHGPAAGTIGQQATLAVLARDGTNWLPVGNYPTASAAQSTTPFTYVMPLRALGGIGAVANSTDIRKQGHCYGNTDRVLRPSYIISKLAGFKGCYGDLDGVYHVSGDGLTTLQPEDILQYGGVDYIAWPSTFYVNREAFAAIKLA